jgi:hypothetical protein
MEKLLHETFKRYYKSESLQILDFVLSTNEGTFAVEDMEGEGVRFLQKNHATSNGTAYFKNCQNIKVSIFNFDKFMTALSNEIQRGKKRCDLLIYTALRSHLLFAELKHQNDRRLARRMAKSQMKDTLELFFAFPKMKEGVESYSKRMCCFFYRRSPAPPELEATEKAFNHASELSNPLRHDDEEFKNMGFEFWEYRGTEPFHFKIESSTTQ